MKIEEQAPDGPDRGGIHSGGEPVMLGVKWNPEWAFARKPAQAAHLLLVRRASPEGHRPRSSRADSWRQCLLDTGEKPGILAKII